MINYIKILQEINVKDMHNEKGAHERKSQQTLRCLRE